MRWQADANARRRRHGSVRQKPDWSPTSVLTTYSQHDVLLQVYSSPQSYTNTSHPPLTAASTVSTSYLSAGMLCSSHLPPATLPRRGPLNARWSAYAFCQQRQRRAYRSICCGKTRQGYREEDVGTLSKAFERAVYDCP